MGHPDSSHASGNASGDPGDPVPPAAGDRPAAPCPPSFFFLKASQAMQASRMMPSDTAVQSRGPVTAKRGVRKD
jgi:hypothetical protein